MADESKFTDDQSAGDQPAGESTGESSSGQSPVAERAADARSADFALICSQRAEVGPLLKHIDRQRKYVDDGFVFRGGFLDQTLRVVVVEAGFDFSGHQKAAQTVMNEHRPTWVISTGFSVGLTDAVKTSDVCLANQISDIHGDDLELSLPLEGGKRVHCGKHMMADRSLLSSSERQRLSESSGADAADMVSLAVAAVCHPLSAGQAATNFLSIRCGLNGQDSAVDEWLLNAAFCKPADVSQPLMMKWLAKLKPDPVRRECLKRLEEISINTNRYVLQVVRKLGEKLAGDRW